MADYDKRCANKDGTAADIARTVMGTPGPGVSGPPDPLKDAEGHDWTQVEFEVIINKTASGFGATGDGIFSSDLPGQSGAPNDPATSDAIWHNHPTADRTSAQQLDDRYPSTNAEGNDDWQTLQFLADTNNIPDPTIYITDPSGVTRSFQLSDRAMIEGLSAAQRQQGVGLDGRDVSNASCS